MEYYLWIGMFAPKNTPAGPMKALREAIRQAVDDPAFKSAMEKIQTPIATRMPTHSGRGGMPKPSGLPR